MPEKRRTPAPPRRVQAPKKRDDPRGPRDARRTRVWIAAAVALLVVAALAAGGYALATRGGEEAAPAGGGDAVCTREEFPDQGRQHITPENEPPEDFEYNSFPPTSGWHDPQPAIWNVYERPVDQTMLVHNLEHGGIVVQYGADVPRETVDEIILWYRADPNGILVAPLPESPQAEELGDEIALTAWTRLAVCSSFDEEEFSSFRDDYRYQGPEDFPPEHLEPGM